MKKFLECVSLLSEKIYSMVKSINQVVLNNKFCEVKSKNLCIALCCVISLCLSLAISLLANLSICISDLHAQDQTVENQIEQATPANSAPAVTPTPEPGIPQESYADYPAVGKETGVWNNGKAALWDLRIIDQWRIFGPEQRDKGYKPEQPINFSHIVHVQKNKMECQYCHWNVAKASFAALPDVESCMGCHNLVNGSDEASQKEIGKLKEYYEKKQPIPWVKVHVMPDHYKFNHKRHVKAGVNCQECHGQIPEMPVVERVSSMKMGWCLDCHRHKGASIDCATCHY
jgi:hypothetical protein